MYAKRSLFILHKIMINYFIFDFNHYIDPVGFADYDDKRIS